MKRLFLQVVLLVVIISAYGQSTYKSGVMPQFNIDASLKNKWKFNTKVEGRLTMFKGNMGEPFKSYGEAERIDLEMVAVKSLNNVNSLGGGYLLRNEQGNWIHRFIQQYSIASKINKVKLAHRIRTDQTIEPASDLIFRLRYRASFEIPLNGQVVDYKEFYMKINNEYLGWVQGSIKELDIRALVSLGYKLSDKYKFESGIDYRAEEIINGGTKNHFWLNIACYLSL